MGKATITRYMIFDTQSAVSLKAKGHWDVNLSPAPNSHEEVYKDETKGIPITSKHSDSLLKNIPPLRIGEIWGNGLENEPRMIKAGIRSVEAQVSAGSTACKAIFSPTTGLDRGNL